MKQINEKRFDYFLNVLPPLVMGLRETICFLKEFDHNPIAEEIVKVRFNDLFIQGEGYDYHTIYGVAKDGKYWDLGTTLKAWSTEDFRYDDTGNNMVAKIRNRMGG